jgi:hypothetical protein
LDSIVTQFSKEVTQSFVNLGMITTSGNRLQIWLHIPTKGGSQDDCEDEQNSCGFHLWAKIVLYMNNKKS